MISLHVMEREREEVALCSLHTVSNYSSISEAVMELGE